MSRPTLLYVYDALCGWCYGFSPVMQRIAKTYADTFDFEVLSGGMVRGERIGPIGEVAGYIATAYKQVEECAGVTFGEAFLNGTMAEGTAIFTSVLPSRALTAFKATQPADSDGTEQIAFAHALQRAVYYDGLPPAEPSTYARIATDFALDGNAFAAQLDDPEVVAQTEAEFALASRLGVQGFPTVFVTMGGQLFRVAPGYVPFEQLDATLQRVVADLVA
ncbi:MAG: DsbA family protein [Bacteroidota bacterium]